MNWKVKAGIIIAVIVTICVLVFVVKKQNDTIKELKSIQTSIVEMRAMADGSMRSESVYASKDDIEKAIKDAGFDPKVIRDDISKLNSDLKGVHTIVSKSTGIKYINVPSTTTESNPTPKPDVVECKDGSTVECPDPFGYKTNKQVFKLNEPFNDKSVPIGNVSFSAWEEKPWGVELHPRNYHVTSVVSVDEDGKQTFHNKFAIEVDGKKHEVPIYNSRFLQEYPKSKFSFNPRLYMGVDGGVVANADFAFDVAPNLQVALFSYGKTKKNVDFTFLSVGPGYNIYNKVLSIMMSPINYNVGKHLPLMDNMFIGPSASFDMNRNFAIMFGVRVGL